MNYSWDNIKHILQLCEWGEVLLKNITFIKMLGSLSHPPACREQVHTGRTHTRIHKIVFSKNPM